MKPLKLTALFVLAAIALTACEPKDEPTNILTEEITIHVGIQEQGKMNAPNKRRVATNGMQSVFETGDQIQVYGWTGDKTSVPTNPPIQAINTLQGNGEWQATPQMLWQSQTAAHYFIGIYPVPAKPISDFKADPYTLNLDDQEASDLLVAVSDDQGIVANNRGVDLNFKHMMAKIHVNLHLRTQVADWSLEGVRYFGDKEATINYLTQQVNCGSYQYEPTKYFNLPALATPQSGYQASYETLVIPQAGVRRLDVMIAGYTYSYNGTEDIPLESGKITTINLHVAKDNITLEGITVGDWHDGTTAEGGVAEEIAALNSTAAGTIAANPALLESYLLNGALTITGNLNEADLQALGNWAIANSWDDNDNNNLVVLDLSGTDITAIPSLFMYNNQTKNYSAQYVQKVILPETVTTIDTHAFNCCTALQSINTGKVKIMGNFVFGRCPNISNLDLSALESIKQSAFRECINLTIVNMPVVTDLGGRTFNEAYVTELRIGSETFSHVSIDVFDGFDRKGDCTLYLAANQTVTNEGTWTATVGTDEIETVDVSDFKAVYCGTRKVWPK